MAAAQDKAAMSPRLYSLCSENEQIEKAVLGAGVRTTQELVALGADALSVAKRLGLQSDDVEHFCHMFAHTREKTEGEDEERMSQVLDVLNAEGHLIMKRPRRDVHKQGFWHRAVNVWVVCTSTSRVLLGQRSVSKDMDPHKWTCACGRVPAGELSMSAAVDRLAAEFSIQAVPDEQIWLIFNSKCPRQIDRGLFKGQQDAAWIDVYVCCLEQETPVEQLHFDLRTKHAGKYMSVDDLQRAWAQTDEDYVIPTNEEYCAKLFRYLRKICQERQMDYQGRRHHGR